MTSNHPDAMHATRRLGADNDSCRTAGTLLTDGKLVAFPTETVYGLGADATDPAAIARLYAAKGRPHFNPLIAHVDTVEKALTLGAFSARARRLAETFWPGPLTIVVPVAAGCSICDLARAGLPSLAIRVPDHPVARAILAAAGRPIAAPSANRSGHVSPTSAAHVLADLDGVLDAVVDGGPAQIGVESTIVAAVDDEIRLLRPGGIPREALARVLGHPLAAPLADGARPLAPGRLASHYAPKHRLRLEATSVVEGEACLAFGLPLPPGADPALTLNLSQAGDLVEAAANLYRHLRTLDSLQVSGIAAMPIPESALGEAIRDRLLRASVPKNLSQENFT